jgi:hypothetical protein
VSRIFLSHSSKDTREAIALKAWLTEQRPELGDEIFIDVDTQTGLKLGEQWKTQLFTGKSRCAVPRPARECVQKIVLRWEHDHERRI